MNESVAVMLSRHVISSPRDGLIVIELFGERDDPEAHAAFEALMKRLEADPVDQILIDVRRADYAGPPEDIYARAFGYGDGLAPGKIAILARTLDCIYARFWRRGLIETRHETAVFVCAEEADAWLNSNAEDDTLYLA